MRPVLEGEGVNLKTNRRIAFRIPERFSENGQESFIKNVAVVRLSHCENSKDSGPFVRRLMMGKPE